VKPLDESMIMAVAEKHRAIITIEENAVMGGAGSAVGELLAERGFQLPLHHIGIPDKFIEHGSRDTCLASARLDLTGLTANVEGWWDQQMQDVRRSASSA
jgi:1-deoxy-D-xylulose-5-phosphate synthase